MNGPRPRDDHVRRVSDDAEYAGLTHFLAAANGWRFTVLGLFLAAAGFVLQQPSRWTTLLVFILSVLLWASELRTRALLATLIDRGQRLEGGDLPARVSDSVDNQHQASAESDQTVPFVSRLRLPESRNTWMWVRHNVQLPQSVTHTLMIDMTYLLIAAYCVIVFIVGPEHFQPPTSDDRS